MLMAIYFEFASKYVKILRENLRNARKIKLTNLL